MARKPKSLKEVFTAGFFKQNPTFVQFLGMCPTLAVTGSVENALGMGAGVIFVLVLSNLIISLIRDFVPNEVRIPIYIVVIASLVTVLEMLMNAFVPDLAASLGTFLSLIVVNCLILGRAEAFASKNGPVKSMADGLGMALGFTGGIVLIAFFRELLGSGSITIWGDLALQLIPETYQISILVAPAGAFLVFGILVAQVNKIRFNKEDKQQQEVA
ncbi:Electron transport complex protein RnfE [Candidatus Izimaplasma bacterium HR1]|jgi:electron transport complex protein RnfE|uniref:electron transport complex subunit RsxE n=1 Tax=Candidatus Izimoplasma sp. HR1 TaxID=1541959 RepID=UPI0004F5A34C|nr:Electron transport complex protein RnfE [Candidatus Izimaplasma bacterium HR1]